jgi:predicted  nucleic acid-binding Zn-ribbon protein
LDLIALALHGKQAGFEKVIGMIDEMAANLKKEQADDDSKVAYCTKEFDEADDKKKGLELSIADSETAIEELKGSIASISDEIAALEDGIKKLDKSVAEATDQRKAENADYKELMANDAMAKEVLLWAKNRLNKFYNPKLYKAPPKRDLSAEDQIVVDMGGTLAPTNAPGGIAGTGIALLVQVSAHSQKRQPQPAALLNFQKKTEESGGVIGMIDLLIKDLDKEMQESGVMEKDAQSDYEAMIAQSKDKRATDTESLTSKGAAKAEAEEALGAETSTMGETKTDLMQTLEYIHGLHGECDWIMKFYEVRKEARNSEIDALGKAKAVLSGADFSLLQTSSRSLRGHM